MVANKDEKHCIKYQNFTAFDAVEQCLINFAFLMAIYEF